MDTEIKWTVVVKTAQPLFLYVYVKNYEKNSWNKTKYDSVFF